MLSIYKASAGSGKTHTLTGEYLRMLFRDLIHQETVIPHSHILAVTFTKKATAEMKERILKALFQLSKNPTKSPYYKELINEFHVDQEVLKQMHTSCSLAFYKTSVDFPCLLLMDSSNK